jgi:hypothetical protein
VNGFLWAALVGLAVAGYTAYLRHQAKSSERALVSVETSTTEQLRQVHAAAAEAAGAGAFSEAVELVGTAQPGPAGVLTAPLSEAPCVFFRSRVTRRYRDVTRDSEGRRKVTTREEEMSDERSSEAFALRDASGEVAVLPRGASFKALTKKVSRFEEARDGDDRTRLQIGSFSLDLPSGSRDGDTLGYEYEEWVISPGTRLFVHGEASDADGGLVVRAPAGDGDLVVSQRSEEELLAKHASTIRTTTILLTLSSVGAAVLLVVGLVTALT